jgi:hypothetical protein
MRIGRIVLSLLAVATIGCGEPRAAIEARIDGKRIYGCDDAGVFELTPKPGGWKFACGDGSVIDFFYETDDTPAKGTIETITIQPSEGPKPRDMQLVGTKNTFDCPNGDAERGGEPFPTAGRGVEAGTYTFELLDPCERLEVVIEYR